VTGENTFWIVWAVAFVAVVVGRLADWLNTGALAGAVGLLVALAVVHRQERQ
jgi:hypothetical protein